VAVRKLASGRFVVEFEQSGVRVFRRLHPTANKADAQALEAKLRRDIFSQRHLGTKADHPIAGAIELWLQNVAIHQKDAHRARLRSKAWAPFIVGKTLRQAPEVAKEAVQTWDHSVGTKDATAYKGIRSTVCNKEGAHLSPATINRRLALLKATLKWAYQQGMTEHNLSGMVRTLPESGAREVYLTRAEVLLLAKYAPTTASRSAILLAAWSGLRASELLALQRSNIKQDSLQVLQSKSGKPRIVPVAGPARPYLSALPLGLSYWQLHKEFSAARKMAKLPHVRFHDLRHTAASWLINAGVDLYTVGRILGHSSPLTTQRYAHLSQATLRKAMRKLK